MENGGVVDVDGGIVVVVVVVLVIVMPMTMTSAPIAMSWNLQIPISNHSPSDDWSSDGFVWWWWLLVVEVVEEDGAIARLQ